MCLPLSRCAACPELVYSFPTILFSCWQQASTVELIIHLYIFVTLQVSYACRLRRRARRRRSWGHPRPRQGTSPPAPPYVRVYEGSPDSGRRTASPCWILYIACWLKNSQV